MPGAMVVILPRQPKCCTGQRIKVAPRQTFGKAGAGDGDHALQHAGEGRARLVPRIAQGDGAGDIGGAIHILPAAVHQQKLVRAQAAVGVFGHAVVDDGPMRTGPADGVETDVMQRVGGAAEPFQRADHVNFGQLALWCLCVQPAQEFHHRRPVAQMRLARGGNLGVGLAGFGQTAGIIAPGNGYAGRLQPLAQGNGRRAAVQPHGPGQDIQGGKEGLGRAKGNLRAKMRQRCRIELCRVSEQADAGIVLQDGKAMQHRVARHIRATDVQKPAQAVGQGDHCRRLAIGAQRGGKAGAFGGTGFAGKCHRMRKGAPLRRAGLIRPDPVNRVLCQGFKADAGSGRFRQAGNLILAVQPGVKPDDAFGQMLRYPVTGLGLGPVHRGEPGQINLRFHLRPVAPVDEDPRHIRQNDAKPGGPGKPGQPLQAFVTRGHVFALMRIGTGHKDTVNAQPRQFCAQGRKAGRTGTGVGRGLEGLEHRCSPVSASVLTSVRWIIPNR